MSRAEYLRRQAVNRAHFNNFRRRCNNYATCRRPGCGSRQNTNYNQTIVAHQQRHQQGAQHQGRVIRHFPEPTTVEEVANNGPGLPRPGKMIEITNFSKSTTKFKLATARRHHEMRASNSDLKPERRQRSGQLKNHQMRKGIPQSHPHPYFNLTHRSRRTLMIRREPELPKSGSSSFEKWPRTKGSQLARRKNN